MSASAAAKVGPTTTTGRQPGSSFKPFVLATALKEGISPLSVFDSHPISIFLGNRYWTPSNYEGEYLGPINLVKAIAVSDNSVFAQLTKDVGPSSVAREAHALGITSPLDGVFSIGLGTQAGCFDTALELAVGHCGPPPFQPARAVDIAGRLARQSVACS